MKKMILILILCILFLSANTSAETLDITKIDGNTWNRWDSAFKHNFMLGFMSAGRHIIDNNRQE